MRVEATVPRSRGQLALGPESMDKCPILVLSKPVKPQTAAAKSLSLRQYVVSTRVLQLEVHGMSSSTSAPPSSTHQTFYGEALPTWTYAHRELLDLEYPHFFLKTWQFIGHTSELPNPGDFITLDLLRDSVVVMRGSDGELRAFLNICRHRATRLLEGRGHCKGLVQCPYHGWTYHNDGRLAGIPSPKNFPGVRRSDLGLIEVEFDVYRDLIFVRVAGDGPGVSERLAQVDPWIKAYRPENYVLLSAPSTEIWNANWKIAWDNYLENYHIPIGHPGLHRLVVESQDGKELTGGGSAGFFEMNPRPSSVDHERRYQELVGCTDHRYPGDIQRRWLQLDFESNMGIEFYPSLFSVFQLLPLAADRTAVRTSLYMPSDLSADEEELRNIDLKILDEVNAEDKTICERIQRGVQTHAYEPGPLSEEESGIADFHQQVRELIPITQSREAPAQGELEILNRNLMKPASL